MSRAPEKGAQSATISPFTTKAHDAFKRGGHKRILGAILAAVLLVIIGFLLGPEYDPKEDVLANYGAPGELVIMPQISIKDGQDQSHQLPKSLQIPPPPSRMEIEKEETSEKGSVPVPKETEAPPNDVLTPVTNFNTDAEVASKNLVELNMPQQSNPDLFIIHQVHPQYPLAFNRAFGIRDTAELDRDLVTKAIATGVFAILALWVRRWAKCPSVRACVMGLSVIASCPPIAPAPIT